MSERSGVEIDYCPQCRGVWLDRGELDKILDRSAQANNAAPATPPAPAAAPAPQPGMAPPPLYPNFEPQRQSRGYDEPRNKESRYNEPRYNDRGYDKHGFDQRGYDQHGRRRKKKDDWLGDLFDF